MAGAFNPEEFEQVWGRKNIYHLTVKRKQETGDLHMFTWHHSLFFSGRARFCTIFFQIWNKKQYFLKMQGNCAVQAIWAHATCLWRQKTLPTFPPSQYFLAKMLKSQIMEGLYCWNYTRINYKPCNVTIFRRHRYESVASLIDHWTGTLEMWVLFLALALACWVTLDKLLHLCASVSPYTE